MRKNIYRFIVVSFLMIFNAISVFADSWFVCLSSFRNQENALNCMMELYKEGFEVCLDEHVTDSSAYYRVLLHEPFDTAEKARARKEELSEDEKISELGLFDLWICQGNPSLTVARKKKKVPEAEKNESAVLDLEPELINKVLQADSEVPSAEEKPYTVLIRNFKEEQIAEIEKNRLSEGGYDSFVVKTYDNDTFFSFGVCAGTFTAEEEAESFQKELEKAGIKKTKVIDLRTLQDLIGMYNQITLDNRVLNEDGSTDYPEIFTETVRKLLSYFPSQDYLQLKKIELCDLINLSYSDIDPETIEDINQFDYTFETADAAVYAVYRDELFGTDISVYVSVTNEGDFSPVFTDTGVLGDDDSEDSYLAMNQLETAAGLVEYFYSRNVLCGKSQDAKVYFCLSSLDGNEQELIELLKSMGEKSILSYPQVRKSISVFPESKKDKNRDFLYFKLNEVPEEYAAEKNYSEWALPIVGHWETQLSMLENEELFEVDFFDLDYDYNADKVHGIFVTSHEEEGEKAHSLKVNSLDCWYQINLFSKELSFSKKSFIISVDVNPESPIREEELIGIAEDLQVW